MKTTHLKVQKCKYIPGKMEEGILYYSERFSLAIHLCACGCGEHTVTPINKEGETQGWDLTEDPERPSLRPSIGNMQLPCKSHYWVTAGQIDWCA